jgi:hypothetical protein
MDPLVENEPGAKLIFFIYQPFFNPLGSDHL